MGKRSIKVPGFGVEPADLADAVEGECGCRARCGCVAGCSGAPSVSVRPDGPRLRRTPWRRPTRVAGSPGSARPCRWCVACRAECGDGRSRDRAAARAAPCSGCVGESVVGQQPLGDDAMVQQPVEGAPGKPTTVTARSSSAGCSRARRPAGAGSCRCADAARRSARLPRRALAPRPSTSRPSLRPRPGRTPRHPRQHDARRCTAPAACGGLHGAAPPGLFEGVSSTPTRSRQARPTYSAFGTSVGTSPSSDRRAAGGWGRS